MVGVPIRITTTYEQPPDMSKRFFKKAMRAGHEAMARMWHKLFLPLHFRRNARNRYDHQARKPKYVKKKRFFGKAGRPAPGGVRVRHGGEVDNVWSGDLERNMREWVTVRAFPTRATATMHGPRYISMRPYNSGHPDKAAELTDVSADEKVQLTAELDRVVTREFAAYKKRKTVRT
ncbi:MAG: hypothetical protein GY838_03935 [bacterium]|nr:hypothetical protein [bacterium]